MWGFDAVKDAVFHRDAYVVFVTPDLSEGSTRRIKQFCTNIVDVKELPYTKEDLLVLTTRATGVFAVCDENLASLCLKHMQNT